MNSDLMTLQGWKRVSSGGFFTRRKNRTLLAIDAELEKYHSIPAASKHARYMGLLGIYSLCDRWLTEKANKQGSSRKPWVKYLASEARTAAALLEQEIRQASEKGGARWALLRRIFVPQGKPGGKFTAATHLAVQGNQPAYTPQTTGDLDSVIGEIQSLDEASTMANQFLLEASNPDHIYSGAAGPAFKRWIAARRTYCLKLAEYLKSGQGVAPKEPEPFFEWWKKNGGGAAGPDQYIDLEDAKKVQYLSPAERLEYQIHFAGGRMYWGPGGVDGLVDTSEWATSVFGGSAGSGIFVLSPEPRLYAGEQVEGQFHHSSFLSGAPVLAAGEIKARNGELLEVSNSSGHYKPDMFRHYNMLLFLDQAGVNLRRVQSKMQGQGPKNAAQHLQELAGLVPAHQVINALKSRVAAR